MNIKGLRLNILGRSYKHSYEYMSFNPKKLLIVMLFLHLKKVNTDCLEL